MNQITPQEFVASLSFDIRLAPYDVQGSIAHATMLGKTKIIPQGAVKKIVSGLNAILKDLKDGRELPDEEDIHMAIEKELIRRIGEPGKMLHTARSRNDQVATDLHLFIKDQVRLIEIEIKTLQTSLIQFANQNKAVLMPGYTHMQHAQPILLAHHVLSYAWMLERDKGRLKGLKERADVMPLGSAALAGTSFPIDRKLTAKLLGFKNMSENSIDATASRDVVVEFLAAASILMTHLSRLSEELILWSSSEFSFIQLSNQYTTGSSIMPQKRNPDMAELIRGKTGRVIGDLMALLTIVKGTPLAYNRDFQEDKPPLFDAVDQVRGSLQIMEGMIRTLKIDANKMQDACANGFLNATELADFLTKRGVPFRSAHGTVKRLVDYCDSRGKKLKDISVSELKKVNPKFSDAVKMVLNPHKAMEAKKSYGGTSTESVKRQIEKLRKLSK